jgi:hypothetical protein
VAGKGVKKNGVYLHDRAASFESLPPGPDPKSISQNVHQFVPKLTKKGTIFRVSQATIEQRNRELTAMMEKLFEEDVPTLIREVREERTLANFFAYWRRDHDRVGKEKERASKLAAPHPRTSISSSVFSMYFHSSSQSTVQLSSPQSTVRDLPQTPTDVPDSPLTYTRPFTAMPYTPVDEPTARVDIHMRRYRGDSDAAAHPNSRLRTSTLPGSPSPPSSHDSRESLAVPSPLMMGHEIPIIFDPGADYSPEMHANDRPLPSLEETIEPKTPFQINFVVEGGDDDEFDFEFAPVKRESKAATVDGYANRNAKIFMPSHSQTTPPPSPSPPPQSPLSGSDDSSIRGEEYLCIFNRNSNTP